MKFLMCLTLLALAAGVAAEGLPPLVSTTEMLEDRYRDKLVRVSGTVLDVFPDELGPNYVFLVINTATGPATVAMQTDFRNLANLRALIDAEVEVTGFCRPSFSEQALTHQPRHHVGRILSVMDYSLRVLSPAPVDPFLVPELARHVDLYPYQIQQMSRRRVAGRVLAAWGGNEMLLETRHGALMRVELSEGPLPSTGDFVETVGHPDTDLYRLNLTRAIWRPTAPWPVAAESVRTVTPADILTDGRGHARVCVDLYGKLVRLVGIVRTSPNDAGILLLESDGYQVPVDMSACTPDRSAPRTGSRLRVTGRCLLNIENWRPNAVFPQNRGFTLVLRSPGDVEILARPSWWTAARLAWTLALVLVLLVAILVWNASLRTVADRRGRQLAKEQVRRAMADVKVRERTRLSADLHDALSQMLAGIAMQLGAIKRYATADPAKMATHLDIASRTLKSCREEMRNLLFDLRSQVLDEPDFETALRTILEPHLGETAVRIRFAVPRAQLSDATARTLYSIVRELVVNAIRHAHARSVRIAGSLEDGKLLFSVRDDGCGFDPAAAPGAGEGHFGLQGIRERLAEMDGELTIDSKPGAGTKITVSIAAWHVDERERTNT